MAGKDIRESRGKEIAENGSVKKVNDHSFKVRSQSGKGAYEVNATPNGMTCTCVNGGIKLSTYGGIKLTTYLKSLLPA